ncbi:MAG: ExbD/TolR family protein [Candidatus Methylacidiphilales bacterium]|nr:biopolymer transporter ExbD [Candidatus Methylacidiphilales bacterium]
MAGGGGGESGEFGLQIAPMLDVMFVLLLFFMVSAGGQQKEAELGIKLPGRSTQPLKEAPSVPVLLDISATGQVFMNQQEISTPDDKELDVLVKRLASLVEADPKQVVVINPALSAKNGRIVSVLSACNAAKVTSLAFGIPK